MLFLIAYWIRRHPAYVAVAMVFLVMGVVGLMRRRKMPSV